MLIDFKYKGAYIEGMDIDFEKILSKLQEKGMTQSAIAADIGCSQPAISGLATGKFGKSRPSYKIVSGLLALAARYEIEIPKSTEIAP